MFIGIDVIQPDEDAIIDKFLTRFVGGELNGWDEHSLVGTNIEVVQEEPFQEDEAQDKEAAYEDELHDEDMYQDCMDEFFCVHDIS
ncbi:hypothetical protein L7F22_032750 [Adiantum nelumboides]|nr:hypothetical protein [Adiantum nelumboides]